MKIQQQNRKHIVPIFAGFALVMGVLTHLLEWREVLWGVRESASALGVAVSEYLRLLPLDELRDSGGSAAAAGAAVRAPLERLVITRVALGFSLSDADSGKILLACGADSVGGQVGAIPGGAPDGVVRLNGGLYMRAGRQAYVSMPVRSAAGAALILHLSIDAGRLDRQAERGVRNGLMGLLVAMGVGLTCAWLISSLTAAHLRRLERVMADASAGGDGTDCESVKGLVQELNDLSNTFETMVSLLRGVVLRARRNLLDLERFRVEDDLATALEDIYWTPKAMVRDGMAFVARRVGANRHGGFFDLVDSGDVVLCVFGNTAEGLGLEATRRASAALKYIEEHSGAMQTVLAEAVAVFGLGNVQVLCFDAKNGKPTLYSCEAGGRVAVSDVELGRGARRVFHDLGPAAAKRFDLYMQTFPAQSAVDLVDELLAIAHSLAPELTGHIVLVSNERSA